VTGGSSPNETNLASSILGGYNPRMSAAALRQAFFQLPASEQAALLDDLIVGSCDAAWETLFYYPPL